MKNPYKKIVNQYKTIELKTRVEAADPHELINMLLQGARNHIAAAQGSMARKQLPEKGEHLSKALSIIAGLKSSLNLEAGGEIATNLMKVYDYIEPLILKANINNDESLLVQSNTLLAQIHEAWQEITPHTSKEN
ncbi:MAG: flagellar export chaperone FliS [Legionella sp.]|uniref:flagellar export chaperone FliS n=1 Tax=Legionella sp. TaxID=459 RepID=UPI0039E6EF10